MVNVWALCLRETACIRKPQRRTADSATRSSVQGLQRSLHYAALPGIGSESFCCFVVLSFCRSVVLLFSGSVDQSISRSVRAVQRSQALVFGRIRMCSYRGAPMLFRTHARTHARFSPHTPHTTHHTSHTSVASSPSCADQIGTDVLSRSRNRRRRIFPDGLFGISAQTTMAASCLYSTTRSPSHSISASTSGAPRNTT